MKQKLDKVMDIHKEERQVLSLAAHLLFLAIFEFNTMVFYYSFQPLHHFHLVGTRSVYYV